MSVAQHAERQRRKLVLTVGALLYIALDDKHYEKEDLNGNWQEPNKPNEVYTEKAWDIATDTYDPERSGPETYNLSAPQVPIVGSFIGIPATEKYVDKILKAEIAELQVWFGKSIDTALEHNRRAFHRPSGRF